MVAPAPKIFIKLDLHWIEGVVDTVLKNHSPDCIFAEGARGRIIQGVLSHPYHDQDSLFDWMVLLFKAEEVCGPPEGVDPS